MLTGTNAGALDRPGRLLDSAVTLPSANPTLPGTTAISASYITHIRHDPQVEPARPRALCSGLLDTVGLDEALANDDNQISLEDEEPVITPYDLPTPEDDA